MKGRRTLKYQSINTNRFKMYLLLLSSISNTSASVEGGISDCSKKLSIRSKEVKMGGGEKIAELLTTHPNMLKRIKHLSTLA